ncbi:MAG: transcriptional regulator, partial [Streptosporangiaceae bacterium]
QAGSALRGFASSREVHAPVPPPRLPEAGARRSRSLETLARLAEKLSENDANLVVDAETAGQLLAVTPRTARRLLHILVEEGLAWPLPPNRTPQPGRPRQFYRLVVEQLEQRRRDEPGKRATR